jgi:ABC-type uncharacterized transport system involved in gliding motility auxiliary subunit
MSKPRPDASPSSRPSKKRRLQLPHEVIELIDSDSEETAEDIDVIEIFDSDQESDPPATRRAITTPDSVFNPNDLLQTRRTVRNWLSNEDFAAWVISREVFQSEQLDRDRKLPAANLRDLSSSYVRPISVFFSSIF